MLTESFIQEMKQKLIESQTQFELDLKGLPVHTEIDTDPEAQQDEAEQDFDNAGVRERLKSDLQKITWALEKIEQGTYGTDDEGNEISEERLQVLPWADKAL